MTSVQCVDAWLDDPQKDAAPTRDGVPAIRIATPKTQIVAVSATQVKPTWIWFDQRIALSPKARTLLRWFARLIVKKAQDVAFQDLAEGLYGRAKKKRLSTTQRQRLQVCATILMDLVEHGWRLRITRRGIDIASPPAAESPGAEKERVRHSHLIERDNQLSQSATARFIQSMERRRLTKNGWKSIFSLMRDGRDLAAQLDAIQAFAANGQLASPSAARACIDPYVQVISPGQVDEFTGLRLMDVWRYFRHTWSTTYQSTPGRKVFVLVRDRAVSDHPVIGIGAVGSAIVQLSERDRWIGWSSETFLADLETHLSASWARWVDVSLRALIDSVYRRDFLSSGLITTRELKKPTADGIARLRLAAKRAKKSHRLFAHVGKHKARTQLAHRGTVSRSPDWRSQALTFLFQAKRASTLADLLEVRRRLSANGFIRPTAQALQNVLSTRAGRRGVQTILRHVRAAHVGVDMLDITVCGAIAPYGPLLGGKLVSLLMASPEIVVAYEKRYRRAESIIASSMAGRPVRRRPRLVLLGTTSLYGVASSQYNRLVIPAANLNADRPLQYVRLGHTAGYGSYHFSRGTMKQLETIAAQARRGRQVNSIFGEGVNPKLRKIRTALDALGLPSERLLQHGSPRLIYAVALATNFREVLTGTAHRPKYLLSRRRPKDGTKLIIDHWIQRWLIPRVRRDGVLDAVRANTLIYPVQHGARVRPASGADPTLAFYGRDHP